MKRVLVIAPHADDEVLGVGGTIARLTAEGNEVHVAVVTIGHPPAFDESLVQLGKQEALEAHRLLGVAETTFLDLPAAELDMVPHREVNAQLADVLHRVRPQIIFGPFAGDMHLDHQLAFLSLQVAARPNGRFTPRTIYAYETLSETNWSVPYVMPNFTPNTFIDVSAHVETKIAAMETFTTQIKPFPHARSAEALRALAAVRGSTVGCAAAEAFVLLRQEF